MASNGVLESFNHVKLVPPTEFQTATECQTIARKDESNRRFSGKTQRRHLDQYAHTRIPPRACTHTYTRAHTHFAHISVSIEHVLMYSPDFKTSAPSTLSSLIVPEF